ncbi:MAG: hypothetical protein L6R38_005794 [Xanthoria sp. 2 TBL-2021]|nr:MAG: hypothetical protein L6R38_005794 [Xanthoria sp. 2 TBL-2021]
MAEKFPSQGTTPIIGNVPAEWTDSGLWSADKQQPTESRGDHRRQEALRPNSPSDIELPPSPALSSQIQQDDDMVSLDLPGGFPTKTGNDDDSASRPPDDTAYPSPSPSDRSMKDDVDRAPAHTDLDAGSPGCDDKQSEPGTAWTDKNERIITRPFEYLMAKPGKSFRRQLLSALNIWTDVDESSLGIINRVVEMLHNASLLIDDIQDNSRLRRGGPAAHLVFGIAQTINAANYIYYLAQRELTGLRDWSAAIQIFNEELLNLHRGQGLDLFWRDTLTVPSEEEYMQMISFKTGGLFRLAARLLQSASSASCDLVPLVETVGLIFQIRDDYQNLCNEHMASAKGYCDDLTEGKFSFPVVHSIRSSADGNNELLNILKQHTDDVHLKAQAVWYMQTETDSFEYTKGKLRGLHAVARTKLVAAGPSNEAFEQILVKLAT